MKKVMTLMAIAAIACSLASCTKESLDEIVLPDIEQVSNETAFAVDLNIIDEAGLTYTQVTLFDENGISIHSYMVTSQQWNAGSVSMTGASQKRPAYLQCPNAAGDGRVYIPKDAVQTKSAASVQLVLVKK